jgi:ABC-type amino acid transport substrate-binding protein
MGRWHWIFSSLLCATMLVLTAAPPSFAADTDGPTTDLRSIKASGTLRIAITHFDIPPFHVRRADGSYVGKDIDFARELGDALKLRIAFVDTPATFDDVVTTVASGNAEIGLSKLSQTYDRVAAVRFSAPYLTLKHALLYNRLLISALAKGGSLDAALRHFDGKIGVIGGSAYVDFATADYPKAEVMPFPSWDATIQALKDGKVDVVYRDEFEIRTILVQDPAIHIQFGAAVLADRTSFLAMAICDSCVKLEEFINYFIAQHPSDYSVDQLLTTHYPN